MKFKDLRVARAKRTVMGRVICRLIGEEMGAVAMEYVVIALLIIAAAVGAAVYFGKTVSGRMKDVADMTNAADKMTQSGIVRERMKDDKEKGNTITNQVSNDIAGGNKFNAENAASGTDQGGGTDGK